MDSQKFCLFNFHAVLVNAHFAWISLVSYKSYEGFPMVAALKQEIFHSHTGYEFRVVILSVVRTHYSIDKDLMNQCSFYTESRILNSTFTRVQSLIVVAAHPLSLITRGHMSCRLFWASYLSHSLSKEECSQLKTEFVNECKVDDCKEAGLLSPEDYEVCCMLIKDQQNTGCILTDKKYYDKILDDLEKEYVSDDEESLISDSEVRLSSSNVNKLTAILKSNIHTSHGDTITVNSSITATGATGVVEHYKPYDNNRLSSDRKLYTVMTARGCGSGYALVLNPADDDIWLADVYALNRSLRGDTVAVEKLGSKKGRVIANECRYYECHPKKFFVCSADKYNKSRLVPIDRQCPKIHTLQRQVSKNGLKIYVNFSDHSDIGNSTVEIMYGKFEKYVYLVWLNPVWSEHRMHPTGVPVKYFHLDGNLTTFCAILKYNYIPAMPSYNFDNDSGFSNEDHEAADCIAEQFSKNIENEIKTREKYVYNNVFTIDNKETVVFDDALSLEHQDESYIVNVHIADASYFVKPGSTLDKTASERGRTFYINYGGDLAIFMLPNKICMEYGNLKPDEERLAVTTQFVFCKRDYSLLSEPSDVEVHRSIVHSVCRLTKEEAGRFLLDDSMTQLKNMNDALFSKMKNDLSILGKIATELRKSQWPNSHLYEPDRGKQDKYTMAGSSLVEIFMCLCNTAIPAKLLKRDGRVGPVLVHAPLKHDKQRKWLEKHHHLLECCPLFNRMISEEVFDSFIQDPQNAVALNGNTFENNFLTVDKECWDIICNLAERSDDDSLATHLCSLKNFPQLFIAYQQLCRSQSKSFYDVITDQAQASEYKHSHFNKIYTHFTSPLRRYCDLLVHRAILGETSLPSAEHEGRELLHKMNIHKWDEREFSRKRNALYFMDCYIKQAKAIAVTGYVGKFTNKLMELHAPPELQEFLRDGICDIKLAHLQAKGSKQDKMIVMRWQVEIIPAPGNELSRNFSERSYHDVVKVPLRMLGKVIEDVHNKEFNKAKNLIKSWKPVKLKYEDVEQKKNDEKTKEQAKLHKHKKAHEQNHGQEQEEVQHSRRLTFTKWIREYSKLDIQLSFTQERPHVIEPTVSLVHISQTFSCCLLHVKHPVECYAPNILLVRTVNLKYNKTIAHYVKQWRPAVEAESLTNSITSKRIPLIIKDLQLKWISNNKAQFTVTDYAYYKRTFQKPFSHNDYVCIRYHNLLSNPNTKDCEFELDRNKKITWVAHGRIVTIRVTEHRGLIIMEFPKDTVPPNHLDVGHSQKLCDLEVIPFQVTFR